MTQTAQPPRYFEVEGEIKSFNPQKGYGFVTPDDKELGDLFLHSRCLEEHGLQTIEPTTRVVCNVERRRRDESVRVKKILRFGH